ncbi:IS66 family transposase [Algoriphagus sp. C2-6-M1]|uniref:IS66 family transposase n=1 Tax=Algoriphagus persicinus TaxID=3108754 RepID=UPI002B367B51|nr:IS66 family transposase [Algoriphagus sp. C2-6-M1]MEB2782935.1 IS66 family transposase [Algoriphagus sp. C2-6-M1]
MNNPLDQLSKTELIALLGVREQQLESRDQRIEKLEGILAKFQKMLFGQKRERFESPDQLSLPFETAAEVQQAMQEELTQKVEYIRRKSGSSHPGRTKLPEHLPVEEIELYPEGNLEEMTCIGKEVTEELDYIPGSYIIRRYIRYKYASNVQEGKSPIVIAALPSRLIDKSSVGNGLLASILTDKYVDHLPLYRQLQRFKRENIPIAASTLDGWTRQGMERLEILYDWLVKETCGKGYLQADETTIKVLDSTKKKDTHLGYYWVHHNPVDGTVLFDYQKGRDQAAPKKILQGFKGYLQSDGYATYEYYANQPGVTHLGCWAHAHRKFFEALENDKTRATLALAFIGKLYEVETHCRDKQLSANDKKSYRLDHALPVLEAFSSRLKENYAQVLPKSIIGKAMSYTMIRWEQLSNYLMDGMLEIDNNKIENVIRPVALGRKNYLFAGSHDAAQRAAMSYSFFAMCKKEEVNTQQWLKYVFDHIMDTNIQKIQDLLPKNYKLSLVKTVAK